MWQTTNFKEPLNVLSDDDVDKIGLRYYNANIHRASFHLPQFAHKVITYSSDVSHCK